MTKRANITRIGTVQNGRAYDWGMDLDGGSVEEFLAMPGVGGWSVEELEKMAEDAEWADEIE